MKATIAKEAADKFNKESADSQYQKVLNSIKKAANVGDYVICVPKEQLSTNTLNLLRADGYDIEDVSLYDPRDQSGISEYKISWK